MVERCTRCILPKGYPGLTFDEQGVCSYCRKHEQMWGEWKRSKELQERSEKKLLQIFDWARSKKRKYDALVAVSGGKDSCYALHLCQRVYGLKVLAFTNNHGIRSDFADQNVAKMIAKLDVDHVWTREPIFLDLYRHAFLKTGHFCSPCMLGTFNSNMMIAERYDIPLVVWGSSSRTDAGYPKEMNPWNPWYFHKVLKHSDLKEKIKSTLFGKNFMLRYALHHLLGKRKLITLPNYIIWDEQAIMTFLQDEYGLEFRGEHKDCIFTDVAAFLQKKHNPALDPDVMKYSSWIRNGQMERDEALGLIGEEGSKPPEAVSIFLERLKLTSKEFEEASKRTPSQYLKGPLMLAEKARRVLRRQY